MLKTRFLFLVCKKGQYQNINVSKCKFFKTEFAQAEEIEQSELDTIIRTATEDVLGGDLEFDDFIDSFTE